MTTPFLDDGDVRILLGDAREQLRDLPDGSVDAVVTSPPYLDARPEYADADDYPAIFAELARVVSGPMLWNVGRIWRGGIEQLWWLDLLAYARDAGWEHWDTGVWIKPNANPIHGRVLADSHEYVLLFGRPGATTNEDGLRTEYAEASIPRLRRKWVRGRGVKLDDRETQDGRAVNGLGARARSFFIAYVGREKGNPHPAPMALALADDLVVLACREGGTILDPFAGSGTTGVAARRQGRRAILVELSRDYAEIAAHRLAQQGLALV